MLSRSQRQIALLGAAYVAAAFLPDVGIWLRGEWSFELAAAPFTSSPVHFLLAFLLFSLGIKSGGNWLAQWRKLLRGLAVFWTIRTAAVLAILAAMWSYTIIVGPVADAISLLAIGMLLAVTLPAAGSSAGWIVRAHADAPMGAAVVAGSTLTSVAMTTVLLSLPLPQQTESSQVFSAIHSAFQPDFAIAWVCLPLLAGMIAQFLLRRSGRDIKSRHFDTPSLVALLLLNYANGAVCLPQLLARGQFGAVVATALVALVGTFALREAADRFARLYFPDRAAADSLGITTAMSNTGLGLIIATTAVPDEPLVPLALIGFTFGQHAVAAWRADPVLNEPSED
ncbi:hypothetical protein [Stratiformator vulcanicus]|uniref:Sodium Bile acid symporter family protein n=1 Tax=Stratiformator vulcanicus TaxID=2527980 RepID=A0A517R4B5_9PLAN|nr:hypothetical protein [Stratiformator vulcanicus]QDT38729.1 hypothetical protein Pan189_31260 [Stratiformator vulcanicus]